ncbi:MAG: glycosyltransferase family 39 protein [Bacteroidales bacterium]|nr:glycosyltransferase family 39 protein [Bacteroidales bacterium]
MPESLKPAAIRWLPGLPAMIFFLLFLALGLTITGDYGIHWDDHAQYRHGLVTADFAREFFQSQPERETLSGIRLEEYKDRTHGVVFQMLALGIQNLLRLDDPRDTFLLRHYMTFIVFFIGLIFFYRLLKLRFDNPALALLGVVMMILSPRIFADSFYNSKDVVFLSLTIINTWTLVKFLQRPTVPAAMYHALAGALLIAIRITGLFVPAITLLFVLLISVKKNLFLTNHEKSQTSFGTHLRSRMITAGIYLVMTLLLTIVFWPYLWRDPFSRLSEIFTAMSHFKWDDPVLFRGDFISPTALPFYYIPYWIAITTPMLYSLLFLAGIGFTVFRRRTGFPGMIDLVNLALFFFPLLAVVLLGSVIYDGWRQMFFLCVPMMLLAMTGFSETLEYIKRNVRQRFKTGFRLMLFGIVAISWAGSLYFMVRYHPNQHVYFNCLAGKETTRNFEADYWGLSYRQVLEYLLVHDPSDTILVFSVNWPGEANADILPVARRKRLHFVPPEKAVYYLSNYRFPPEHHKFFSREYPYDQPVTEVSVKKNKISGAYRLTQGWE